MKTKRLRQHKAFLMRSAVYQVRLSPWLMAWVPLGTLQDALIAAMRGRR